MNSLSEKDAEFYYKALRVLLDYSNRRFHIDDKTDFINDESLNPMTVNEASNKIWENPSLIDDLINEAEPDERMKNLLASWKNFKHGLFFVERHLKNGSIMIGDDNKVYQVVGIYDPLEYLLIQFPMPVAMRTTLLPFEDVIITTGLHEVLPVMSGPGIKASLKETYLRAKNEDLIIKKLPETPSAAYVESNRSSGTAKRKSTPAKRTMMSENLYQLKVYPKGNGRDVYRVIEICGDATLRDLCHTILTAFDFDWDHMFEFCMDNKMYSHYSYQSDPSSGAPSVDVPIDSLRLTPKQKFSLHYDFGDDWMFVIHVNKILETEKHISPRTIKREGTIRQYWY